MKKLELYTVTRGQASTPYLAIRRIKQLINEDSSAFPMAAKTIKEYMYVDDLAKRADTLEEANKLQGQVIVPLKNRHSVVVK